MPKRSLDTALVVIGRSSGEGSDLANESSDDNNFTIGENGEHVTFPIREDDLDAEKSYLELSNREIAMLDEVTKDFKDVIVVINSAQPMELGMALTSMTISKVPSTALAPDSRIPFTRKDFKW